MSLAAHILKKPVLATANAALFDLRDRPDLLQTSVLKVLKLGKAIVVSDDVAFLSEVPKNQRIDFAAVGLERVLMDQVEVFAKLKLKVDGMTSGLVIDMRWAIANSDALRGIEQWGGVAERLSAELVRPVISVYDHDLLIEEHMQTAFRVHSKFLAPSGIYENPYWLPAKLLNSAALDEQLAFMLGRVVPDHAGLLLRRKTGEMLAHGATPSWIPRTNMALGASSVSTRWQIHCFGQLRVSIAGQNIDWHIAGSAPKKVKRCLPIFCNAEQRAPMPNK